MKTFKSGGIHPDACKFTAGKPIANIAEPDILRLSLQQSIGKPARPVVKGGDVIDAGQLIAEADGAISANLHAPRSGKVLKIEKIRGQQGYRTDAIIIECDPEAPLPEFSERDQSEISALTPEQIVDRIRQAGIVGMGGAAFPTAVKLTPPPGLNIDTVIINGAECEPYLTCDNRLMIERSEGIVRGASLISKAVGANRCVIGIEDNKPQAIAAMRQAAAAVSDIEVVVLKTKYPQGGEKQLIAAVTGREVRSGQLPASVGCVVDNVATAYAAYEAIYWGKPLIERVVTVVDDQGNGGNYLVPIGVSLSNLLQLLPAQTGAEEIIAGGPMMGRAVSDTEAPVVKATSGLLVIKAAKRTPEQPCIRCGRCLHGCPMGLEPYLLIALARRGRWEDMKANCVMDCIECGSCSWSCPSHKPLLDYIKLGKINIRKQKA